MLLHDAGLSFFHYTVAFILVGALSAEAFILRLPVDGRVAKVLGRADAFYGASAALLIVAGFSRAVWGAKGWDYYAGQPFFWAKLAVFVAIGLLSISPTLRFLRWNKAAKGDPAFIAPDDEVKRTRTLVMIELHLLAVLLICAALMARGMGAPL
ncbi:MAG: DUF2214 family protein [Hyphomonadaceae bacterium]|nr:DUF2214 family protein [Hyphomonadaceae bacterium]